MSRAEALEQYANALKMGKKYYNACMAKGQYPYPRVLDEMLSNVQTAGTVNVGLVDIPSERIVGTWTSGRKAAFAGNFMPLLDSESEFGAKWIALCEAHLGDTGITDPITCFEYLGDFYVKEGHKRVSVLKSYDSPTIPGLVTRVLPAPSDDKEVQIYNEFLKFYKVSRLYLVTFTQLGGYAKLQAALGFSPEQEWTEEARRSFAADFRRFSVCFEKLNTEKLPITAGDALLEYLRVHPYTELRESAEEEVLQRLTALWPDLRLLTRDEPISVSSEPEEKEKGLLNRLLGGPRLHAAFVYNFDPHTSAWASAHEQGQKYLQEKLGDSVKISECLCGEHPDEAMEEAVKAGANVIFATDPTLIDACRRLAGNHKNLAIFNCSLSMPYTGVRSYYARIYEGKFITGAIAGAMAADGRIGYVANYPIMGVTAAVNAFALGARLTNPRARISLKWSCTPGNPVQELKESNVSVISNRDDDGAKPFLAWQLGTYQVKPEGGMIPLASPRWNWGVYYEKTVRALQNGGLDALKDPVHAVNDWWGISTGLVDVDLDDRLPAGVRQLARILKNGIISEEIDPFLCPIRDQQGKEISDGTRKFTPEELMGMDWLCENVDGAIPGFEELLPQSQGLVRLLGLYRDSIPPLPEDAAL